MNCIENRLRQATDLCRVTREADRKGTSPQDDFDCITPEETRLMFHELCMHQMELEKQIETLLQAQVKLDNQRARYFDLYESAPVGYCTLSAKGLILETNLIVATLLGVPRGELTNQPLAWFIQKDDQDIYNQNIQSLHRKQDDATCGPQKCELRMRKQDGTVFWAQLVATTAKLAGTIEYRLVINDITESKRTEGVVAASAELKRQIVDAAGEGIWVMDANRRTMYVNHYLAELLGYAPKEMVGRPMEDFMFAKETADRALCMESRIQNRDDSSECRFRGKDGREIWSIVSASALRDRDGQCTGDFFAILTDITHLKQTEEVLRENEQKAKEANKLLKRVLDTIPFPLYWKDLTSVYLGCNQSFAQDAGFKAPEEVIGLDDHNMQWKELAEIYHRDDREVMKSGKPRMHYEEIQTTSDGQKIWISTSKMPLRDANNKTIGIVGTYRNITQHKWAEEKQRNVRYWNPWSAAPAE